MRRSGLLLACCGLAGLAFFWLTDPSLGFGQNWSPTENIIDAAHDARFPTAVGLVGSLAVLGTGLWLTVRKAA